MSIFIRRYIQFILIVTYLYWLVSNRALAYGYKIPDKLIVPQFIYCLSDSRHSPFNISADSIGRLPKLHDSLMAETQLKIDRSSVRQPILGFFHKDTPLLPIYYDDDTFIVSQPISFANRTFYSDYKLLDRMFDFEPGQFTGLFHTRIFVSKSFIWFEVKAIDREKKIPIGLRRTSSVYFGLDTTQESMQHFFGANKSYKVVFWGGRDDYITAASPINLWSFNYEAVRMDIDTHFSKSRSITGNTVFNTRDDSHQYFSDGVVCRWRLDGWFSEMFHNSCSAVSEKSHCYDDCIAGDLGRC